MAKTNAQRQANWRKRQTIRGKVLRQVWVTKQHWPILQALLRKLEGK